MIGLRNKDVPKLTSSALLALPAEVLSQIILQLIISEDDTENTPSLSYPLPSPGHGWSFYLHEARSRRCLRATCQPICSVLLSCRQLYEITVHVLKSSFTGSLVFTTAATPWRTFTKLRALSIQIKSIGWYLNNIRTLMFRAPPLFTSRIPWTELPGVKLVILDYSSRRSETNLAQNGNGLSRRGMRLGHSHNADMGGSSNNYRAFDSTRVSQALRSSGELDEVLLKVAKDTERFDMPVIDDARRVSSDLKSLVSRPDSGTIMPLDYEHGPNMCIQVRIVKVLKFLYFRNQQDIIDDTESAIEGCFVRVVASYSGDSNQVTLTVLNNDRDDYAPAAPVAPTSYTNSYSGSNGPYLIWTAKDGLLRHQPANHDLQLERL